MSFHFRTSQFIIGLNKYLEAINHDFGVGMRFKMRFEGDDSPERRLVNIYRIDYTGTHKQVDTSH